MATYLSPGVYVEEVDRGAKPIEGVGTAFAGFVGFTAKRAVDDDGVPLPQPVLVSNWSEFADKFGGPVEGGYLYHSVYGWFQNGGGSCYVVGIGGEDGDAGGDLPQATLPARVESAGKSLVFTSRGDQAAGQIKVEVKSSANADPDSFDILVKQGTKEEAFSGLVLGKGKDLRNVEGIVNKESKLVRVKTAAPATAALADLVPAPGVYTLTTPPVQTPAIPQALAPEVLRGDASARTGVAGLQAADDVTMVCAPDIMAAHQAGKINLEQVKALQLAVIEHCELMKDRFAILDSPPEMNPQEIKQWRADLGDSKYAALYYPWIKVAVPGANGGFKNMPPSGHIAGVYARVDAERGVHKAPANEVIRGAVGLEFQITKNEQDTLNPDAVNCIRAFSGRGIRIWGARTLSSDASWRYINVRRLFNYIEESIEEGTQWVVFEPNDRDLWERLKRDVSAFLTREWMQGSLFGSTPAEAFYVKCDDELNPPAIRDAGQLIIEIGLAPVKPAEFVVFRISQLAGGGSVNE